MQHPALHPLEVVRIQDAPANRGAEECDLIERREDDNDPRQRTNEPRGEWHRRGRQVATQVQRLARDAGLTSEALRNSDARLARHALGSPWLGHITSNV